MQFAAQDMQFGDERGCVLFGQIGPFWRRPIGGGGKTNRWQCNLNNDRKSNTVFFSAVHASVLGLVWDRNS